MPKDRPDFVRVRLSNDLLHKLGDDCAVRVSNAHMHYIFQGSTPVEVLRRPEWQMLQHDSIGGVLVFQEAEPSSTSNTSDDEA